MKRIGWQSALILWARRRVGTPFEWGRVDCAMLALEAFDIMTGQAVAESYRGRYSTRAQAIRFQRRIVDLRSKLESLGCARAREPQIGDVVIVEKDGFVCGHVCVGEYVVSAWPDRGVALGETRALAEVSRDVLRIP